MSLSIIKIAGPQFTANSSNLPNTVNGATLLRVLNTSTGNVVVTVANNGANVGSITMLTNTVEYIEKYSGDTITVSNNSSLVLATPVALRW